jgi:hypothetical protein
MEAVDVLEPLVDHRQADDGVDDEGVGVTPPSTPPRSVRLWPTVNRLT